ncbi:recombinase family protein [Pseudomonas sp. Irchel 3A18]|uniref:recombinase family protein n=1 Tax=Pseudomonas sp. Irchel 3A18 TaxID=2008905 RepID=UPI000BA3D128|nr:recombinase family protein [Pseudomonas sp. Irchel 3A18]
MSKAYAYVRWSTAEQGEEGRDSHSRQITPLQAFTEAKGVPVVETVIDKGISAFRGANARIGQLKGLLDRVENGEIERGDYIIVESIDRLTRQKLTDSVDLIQSILKKGVRLHTVFDNKTYSYDDPSRDLETLILVGVIAKRAHEESETKSKRLKSSWLKKRDAAETTIIRKQCPYGFRYDEKTQAFAIVEGEAQEIRHIFELLKHMGILESIKRVNQYSKRRWTRKHIDELIKTKSPIGVLCLSRRKEDGNGRVLDRYVPGYFPKVIEEADFDAAVSAIKGRFNENKRGRRSPSNYNIFRHCIQCELHKVGMLFNLQGLGKEKKRYAYLVCSNRAERVCECDNRIRFEQVFGAFLAFVKQISENRYVDERTTKKRKDFTWFSQEQYQNMDVVNDAFSRFFSVRDTSAPKEEIRAKKALLSTERNTLEMLDASLAQFDGIIPKTFIKRIADCESRITALESEIQNIEGQLTISTETLEVTTYKDVIELYETEEGRLKLNTFFISRGIIFEVNRSKDNYYMSLNVRIKGDEQFKLTIWHRITEKSPLAEFGISDLSHIIK